MKKVVVVAVGMLVVTSCSMDMGKEFVDEPENENTNDDEPDFGLIAAVQLLVVVVVS
jgi:PBP1b-binding outer membrane lipoprotein LpoB